MEKKTNQLTSCDETMKMALNTQTARAKENPSWAKVTFRIPF